MQIKPIKAERYLLIQSNEPVTRLRRMHIEPYFFPVFQNPYFFPAPRGVGCGQNIYPCEILKLFIDQINEFWLILINQINITSKIIEF